MTYYSSKFREIIPNGKLNNYFLDFFDAEVNKLKNDFMPPEVILNSEDIAILQAESNSVQSDVNALKIQVQNLQNYISELKLLITTLKECVFLSDENGNEFVYNNLL